MTTTTLYGTSDAPLAATRRYTFTRATSFEGRPVITLPLSFRGTHDDYGHVTHPEQSVWMDRFVAALGPRPEERYPGQYAWADEAARDRVWEALAATLQPESPSAPVVTLERAVPAAEASALSEVLTARFCALTAALLGFDASRFERFHHARIADDYEPKREEHWRCLAGDERTTFSLHGTGLASGVGVHGEETRLVLTSRYSDGRDARAYARIDLRTGGTVSVTVAGVRDAEALAERFLAAAG